MKHYIEIQRLRTEDVVIDDNLTLEKNTQAFLNGDIISITEKIDGANASIFYDKHLQKLRCFSSRNELDFSNQLRGFYSYVQGLDSSIFAEYPNYIFFGEWLVSHTVIYDEENYNKWYLFSVYDSKTQSWLEQEFVKNLPMIMDSTIRMNCIMENLLIGTIVSAFPTIQRMEHNRKVL